MKVKKGDTVKILRGKDRGKEGKVVRIFSAEEKVLVEGVNMVKRHTKQTGDQKDPGGIIEREAPIHISNVMLMCPSCQKSRRIGYKVSSKGKVRICKKCGTSLDDKSI